MIWRSESTKRIVAVLGILAPFLGHIFIAISIALSPWFSWERNALSDLGHAVRSEVAPVFNFGLLAASFLLIIYAVSIMREHLKLTGYGLSVSTFFLALIAVFDEVYGSLHFIVSILFFVSLALTSLIYVVEERSYLGALAFFTLSISWIFYLFAADRIGVAVPEIISTLAASSWIIYSAIKIRREWKG